MCGESISVRARVCRYCGETLSESQSWSADQEGSTVDAELVKKFRREVHGIGGFWIFIAVMHAAGVFFISKIPKGNANGELLAVLTLALTIGAVVYFFIWIFTFLKQRWALYVGLVFGYLGILSTVLQLANGNACGAIIGLLIYLAVIVQTHRTINLANLMLLHHIPLNTKPGMY